MKVGQEQAGNFKGQSMKQSSSRWEEQHDFWAGLSAHDKLVRTSKPCSIVFQPCSPPAGQATGVQAGLTLRR